MEKNKIFNVKNRSVGVVVYSIREDNIRREFAPGESKNISFEELEKLSYLPGGRSLMANYLQILDKGATEELGIERELEYDMSEQDVARLIQMGSLDEFLDCLDFAPAGVIDLIKNFAVSLPMTDTEKREALKEKTGFDTTVALANIAKEKAEEGKPEVEPTAIRRVKPAAEETARRVKTPEYKITTPIPTVETKEQ